MEPGNLCSLQTHTHRASGVRPSEESGLGPPDGVSEPLQLQHADCLSGTDGAQGCQTDVRTLATEGVISVSSGEQATWVFEEACSQERAERVQSS